MQPTRGRQLSIISHKEGLDETSGIDLVEARRHDFVLGVGISRIDQHGDTDGLHDGPRLVGRAKGACSHELDRRLGEIVGIEGGPVRSRQNVTVVYPDDHGRTILRT